MQRKTKRETHAAATFGVRVCNFFEYDLHFFTIPMAYIITRLWQGSVVDECLRIKPTLSLSRCRESYYNDTLTKPTLIRFSILLNIGIVPWSVCSYVGLIVESHPYTFSFFVAGFVRQIHFWIRCSISANNFFPAGPRSMNRKRLCFFFGVVARRFLQITVIYVHDKCTRRAYVLFICVIILCIVIYH